MEKIRQWEEAHWRGDLELCGFGVDCRELLLWNDAQGIYEDQ